jgi:hypothetical protein
MVIGVVDQDVEHHTAKQLLHIEKIPTFFCHANTPQQLSQRWVAKIGLLPGNALSA